MGEVEKRGRASAVFSCVHCNTHFERILELDFCVYKVQRYIFTSVSYQCLPGILERGVYIFLKFYPKLASLNSYPAYTFICIATM